MADDLSWMNAFPDAPTGGPKNASVGLDGASAAMALPKSVAIASPVSVPASVGNHYAPDGSGVLTDLSDADYYAMRPHTLPAVNLPAIETGGNPDQAKDGGPGAGVYALPAHKGSVIDVSPKPSNPASRDESWMAAFPDAPKTAAGAEPASVPQMAGLPRQIALPASAVAKGIVSAAGLPGDIIRGAGYVAGQQGAAAMRGNPMPDAVANPMPLGSGNSLLPTQQEIAAAPGKAIITAPSAHNPIDSETLLGLTRAAGLTDRPDLQPQNALETIENAAGQGVGMMVPAMLTGGLSAVPRLVASGAVAGLGGEAGGSVGNAIGGEPGHMIGSAIGSVVPALAGAGVSRLASSLAPVARSAFPFTASQRADIAARSFAPANTSEVRAALAAPLEIVPGSGATSYQVTGNPFLGAVEKGLSNRQQYFPAFNELRQRQNTARVAAIEGQAPSDGDIGAIIPWFRDKLNGMTAAEAFDTGADRAATQAAVDAMGNPIAPHDAGSIVRGAVEQNRAPMIASSDASLTAAQRRAEGLTRGLGGEVPVVPEGRDNALQIMGRHTRGVLNERDAAARVTVGKLYDAVDPEGKLRVDMSAIKSAARDISKDIPKNAAPLEGDAGKILGAAMMQPKVQTFKEVGALRSRITDAMREELNSKGRTQTHRRLTQLLSAVDDTLTNGVESAVSQGDGVAQRLATMAKEEINGSVAGPGSGQGNVGGASRGEVGVSGAGRGEGAGNGRPGDGGGDSTVAPARPGRKPESLIDFVIAHGGVKESGGDLRANDLHLVHHRARGRLLNPKGMSADDMARAAADEGFPTRDLNEFLDALSSRSPVYRREEMADAANRQTMTRQSAMESHDRLNAGGNVDDAIERLGVKLSPEERGHAVELHLHGDHPDDAIRQAAREGEEAALQRNAEHNAVGAPGVPLAAQQADIPLEGAGERPNFDAEAAARYRAASVAHSERVQTFNDAPGVGRVLETGKRTGEFKLPDSAVPSAVFASGAKGAESADALIRAAGTPQAALAALGSYPAYSLRQAAEKMGVLSIKDYDKWMASHQAVMDKFPELRARFDTAAKASRVLGDLREQRAAIDTAHPIGPGWGDAEVMQKFVTPGPLGYENAAKLLNATGNSSRAVEATRDYLASSLRDAAEVKSGPNAGTLNLAAYQRWMKQYSSFLSHPAMADARVAFGDAAKAQEALDVSASAHREAQKAYEDSVARHFLKADVDPVSTMGAILTRRDPGPELADLARQVMGDSAAKESMQSAVVRFLLDRLESNNPVGQDLNQTYLKANETQNLIGKLIGDNLDGPLRHILTPDQMKALGDVRMDIRRSNLSVSGNKNPGGSDTGLITSSREADAHAPAVGSTIALMEMAGEMGEHAMNSKWGKVAAVFLVPALQRMRAAGFQTVNDLRAEAILHPEKLSALLARLPTEAEMPSRLAAIKKQLVGLSALSADRAANENREEQRRSVAR